MGHSKVTNISRIDETHLVASVVDDDAVTGRTYTIEVTLSQQLPGSWGMAFAHGVTTAALEGDETSFEVVVTVHPAWAGHNGFFPDLPISAWATLTHGWPTFLVPVDEGGLVNGRWESSPGIAAQPPA